MAEAYYELNRSKDDQFYFNLKAANHKVIATSEMYKTKSAAHSGIEGVRHYARTTDVRDKTAE